MRASKWGIDTGGFLGATVGTRARRSMLASQRCSTSERLTAEAKGCGCKVIRAGPAKIRSKR